MSAAPFCGRLLSVHCPSCGAEVSRGTSICPVCDEILDASVFETPATPDAHFDEVTGESDLSGEPPGGARDDSNAGPVRGSSTEVREVVPEPVRKPARVPAAPQALRAAPALDFDPPSARPVRRRGESQGTSAERLLAENWADFRGLPAFEQLSLASLCFAFIAMVFPWRVTASAGEQIGLSAGTLALVPLLATAAALWIRGSANLRGFRPDQLALIQLLSGLLLLAYCALFFYRTLGAGLYSSGLGVTDLHTSEPEIGCLACGLAALGIAAAGGWAYLEERGLK